MERKPEIGLDSFDRIFPNQDRLPKGGFGNLIALPLQGGPRRVGNSCFVDERLVPYPDHQKAGCLVLRFLAVDVVERADTVVGTVLGVLETRRR